VYDSNGDVSALSHKLFDWENEILTGLRRKL
jgi:hypothetical protein